MSQKDKKKFERFDQKTFNFFKYAPPVMDDKEVRQTTEICLTPTFNFFDSKIKYLYRKWDDITARHKNEQEWLRFYKLAHYLYVACWLDIGMKAANKSKVKDYLSLMNGFNLVNWKDYTEANKLIKRVEHDYNLGLRVNPVKFLTASKILRRQLIDPTNFFC
jgi:hypothetical protein